MHYSYSVVVHCRNKINYRVLQNYYIESRKKMYSSLPRILLCVISHRIGVDFLWKIAGLVPTPI